MGIAGQASPSYRKIPLDTKSKAHELVEWLHAPYRQQITPSQLESNVEAKYPGQRAEAKFIVEACRQLSSVWRDRIWQKIQVAGSQD